MSGDRYVSSVSRALSALSVSMSAYLRENRTTMCVLTTATSRMHILHTNTQRTSHNHFCSLLLTHSVQHECIFWSTVYTLRAVSRRVTGDTSEPKDMLIFLSGRPSVSLGLHLYYVRNKLLSLVVTVMHGDAERAL